LLTYNAWGAPGLDDKLSRSNPKPELVHEYEATIQSGVQLEAVKLVKDHGVWAALAARDLDVQVNVLRKWVREMATDPQRAFPGDGVRKLEQVEIERPN